LLTGGGANEDQKQAACGGVEGSAMADLDGSQSPFHNLNTIKGCNANGFIEE